MSRVRLRYDRFKEAVDNLKVQMKEHNVKRLEITLTKEEEEECEE